MTHLCRPAALLLDFGGVLVQTTKRPGWSAELAHAVHDRLTTAGCTALSVEDVRIDIEAGAAADSHWKNAMSRPPAPPEMTAAFFWAELVAADWPVAARSLVGTEAGALCRLMGELRQDRATRPGTQRLLAVAAERSIRVAVVSNALSGLVHRDYLARTGLDKQLAVQVYSDEVGVRKPNPELIRHAARALGLTPADCWYVGDNFDRDVVCGRRAGAGGTVLMEAADTYRVPYRVRAEPDAVVADPDGLCDLLLGTDRT